MSTWTLPSRFRPVRPTRCSCNSVTARSSGSQQTYELDGLLWHIVDDHEIDLTNIEAFFADRRRDKNVVLAFFELADRLGLPSVGARNEHRY